MSNTELIYFLELCNKTQMIYLTLIKDIKDISAQILLILDDFIIYGSPGSVNSYSISSLSFDGHHAQIELE